MKRRMTMATVGVAVALAALSGCGTSDESPKAEPSASASTSSSPSAEPSTPEAADLAGDWHDTKAEWVVHFHADGTYVEDFQGITDFRVGTYDIDGNIVSLIGDDGNTDKGTIEGETLVFKLGTLTRQ